MDSPREAPNLLPDSKQNQPETITGPSHRKQRLNPMFSAILVPVHAVEVSPTIVPVLHVAALTVAAQKLDINVELNGVGELGNVYDVRAYTTAFTPP